MTRFIVRAIGELAVRAEHVIFDEDLFGIDDDDDDDDDDDMSTAKQIVLNPQSKNEEIDYKLYKPTVEGDVWIVSETDLRMNLKYIKVYSVAN